jgi:hypothetical protein
LQLYLGLVAQFARSDRRGFARKLVRDSVFTFFVMCLMPNLSGATTGCTPDFNEVIQVVPSRKSSRFTIRVSMKIMLFALLSASSAYGAEFSIVFDNRPEYGMPQEAEKQERLDTNHLAGDNRKLSDLVGDSIKTVRVRYFSTNTWANETQARTYIAGLLTDKLAACSNHPMWAQYTVKP